MGKFFKGLRINKKKVRKKEKKEEKYKTRGLLCWENGKKSETGYFILYSSGSAMFVAIV